MSKKRILPLGYKQGSKEGINTGNSLNSIYPNKIQDKHGESVIEEPRAREGEFEPLVVPKHLSIDRLVILLYAKGMSVSNIEPEIPEIYEVNLSTSAISHITNKVSQQAIK